MTFIRKAAEELSELVNDLLDLAKVEAGKVVIRPQEFDAGGAASAPARHAAPAAGPQHRRVAGVRRAGRPAAAAHRREQGLADPAQLHLQRPEVHRAGRGARLGGGRARTTRRLLRGRHGHRHRAGGPGAHLPGVHPGRQSPAEAGQGDGPGPAAVAQAGRAARRRRHAEERAGRRLDLLPDHPLRLPGAGRGVVRAGGQPQVDPTRLPVLVVEDNRETLFIYEKYLKGTGFQVDPGAHASGRRGGC